MGAMGGWACRTGIGFECRAHFCDGGAASHYSKTDWKNRCRTADRIILMAQLSGVCSSSEADDFRGGTDYEHGDGTAQHR